MVLVIALLIALVWTVHQHRERMRVNPDSEELMSAVVIVDSTA
jgi:hypothetical protein